MYHLQSLCMYVSACKQLLACPESLFLRVENYLRDKLLVVSCFCFLHVGCTELFYAEITYEMKSSRPFSVEVFGYLE
jgi:hypothetical protein